MNREIIKLIQRELNEQTPVTVKVDGITGEQTMNALLFIEQIPSDWSKQRQLIGYLQYLCATESINAGSIDGYLGPQTSFGIEHLLGNKETWRDDEGAGSGGIVGGNDWPIQTQPELEKYYGPVGKNQTKIKVPYTLKIAWNKSQKINQFTCHEKVADSVVRVLERAQDHYGDQISSLGLDLWGGCLNVRKMRGGTKWSTHSWGIAIDWDPERNQLKWGKDKANFAKPEYNKWNELWEEEGWVSLGRERNYDWMHIQAAKIRKK